MEKRPYSPMRVKLTGDRRERMLASIRKYFKDQFDEEVSEFRAEAMLDFFVRELGPPVYNQAIRDAYAFMQEKISDLEGEVYEPEDPYS